MSANNAASGAIILAAGGSTRMGRPKQLLEIGGQAMLVRAVCACLDAELWPVVVVLGGNRELIKPALARLPVIRAENLAWQEGMASSLRTGMAALNQFSRVVPGALVALCDQPGFGVEAIRQLQAALAAAAPERGIAAARYGGRCGAPALFRREYFAELAGLTGDQGARAVLRRESEVIPVDLPELAADLDTPEDYVRLRAALSAPAPPRSPPPPSPRSP